MGLLQSLLFWPPGSTWVTVLMVVNVVMMLEGGKNEFRGKNGQYSKLVVGRNSDPKIPSKTGMTVFYSPSFLFGVASFFIFHNYEDSRFFLIRAAITFHFFKRLLEVWFVHNYSGVMTVETMFVVSINYLIIMFNIIYAQYVSCELPEPSIDLKYVGIVLFCIGICGNFYHHWLLSRLRKKGEKEYKIPKGGLFGLVICPHYLFEVLGFWGVAFIAQTLNAIGLTVGITFYLFGRSYATRRWYVSKFEDFPQHVKAIIPYVF